MFFIYLISGLLTCLLLFYIVKYAIKSGIKESNNSIKIENLSSPTIKQIGLKRKYENGEITFEEYKKEWNNN